MSRSKQSLAGAMLVVVAVGLVAALLTACGSEASDAESAADASSGETSGNTDSGATAGDEGGGDEATGSLLCAEMVSADELGFFFEGATPEEDHLEQTTMTDCDWEYGNLELTVAVRSAEGDLVPENFVGATSYVAGLGSHAQQLFEPPNIGFLAVGDRLARVSFFGAGSAPADEAALAKTREIAVRLAGVRDEGQEPTPLILDCSKVQDAAAAAMGRSVQQASSDDDAVCVVEAGEVDQDYLMVTVALVRPEAPRDADAWSESGETVTMQPGLGPDSFTAGRTGSGCVALHPGLEVMIVPIGGDGADDLCPTSVEIAKQLLAEI